MSARRQPAEEDRVQAGDVNPTYTMDEAATIQSRPAQMAQNTCASLTRRWNMQSGREQKREVGKRGRAARTFHEKRATRPHVSWRIGLRAVLECRGEPGGRPNSAPSHKKLNRPRGGRRSGRRRGGERRRTEEEEADGGARAPDLEIVGSATVSWHRCLASSSGRGPSPHVPAHV
ncbi:unnamed protein product [Prorocentrum cordatum]|uniref:Uncharacterized protein n=1 Tax=Prorocentrum cordatum TaxID=2364126 RepID=A0ABN9TRJ7_9DINO|nr:unnamed protein product [Polarella glacialis]